MKLSDMFTLLDNILMEATFTIWIKLKAHFTFKYNFLHGKIIQLSVIRSKQNCTGYTCFPRKKLKKLYLVICIKNKMFTQFYKYMLMITTYIFH